LDKEKEKARHYDHEIRRKIRTTRREVMKREVTKQENTKKVTKREEAVLTKRRSLEEGLSTVRRKLKEESNSFSMNQRAIFTG
jgi:hypothetical protein